MPILIAAATDAESACLAGTLGPGRRLRHRLIEHTLNGRELHVLATGVGMVATASWCSRALAESRYDLAINIGLCGSFDQSLGRGSVVHVVSDPFSAWCAALGPQVVAMRDELGAQA